MWSRPIILSINVPFATALLATACASGDALVAQRSDVAQTIAIVGDYTTAADAQTTSEATARALRSLGYEVLWNDKSSLATGELVEARICLGSVVASFRRPDSNLDASVTAPAPEVLVTRSYQVRFTPGTKGGTRIALVPRILFGDSDITNARFERSRTYEQGQVTAVFQQIERLLPGVPAVASAPVVVDGME